jgi:Zn-dependent M28 family amino/carboxypeptidase
MLKKMIFYALLILLTLAAVLAYPVLKVRWFAPAVAPFRPGSGVQGDVSRLYEHVHHLSVRIGSRSYHDYSRIEEAKKYIRSTLEGMGYQPELQDYEYDGRIFSNIMVSIGGIRKPGETVIIGAHYDTVQGTPGADDNASAVAILLEICRSLRKDIPSRTLKLIFFVLEEPPVYNTEAMGSFIYARAAKRRGEDIRAMLSLEMLGYFSDKEDGQGFPLPLMNLVYSTTPNFIAVVGDGKSKDLVKRIKSSVEKSSDIPVETLSTSPYVPGVALSDHNSFWKMGYPAVMITDTAFYRNPNYHGSRDTIDTLNFQKMTDVLKGLVQTARDLAESS